MQNWENKYLDGDLGFDCLLGSRTQQIFRHGMQDFFACLSEIREIITTQINVIEAKINHASAKWCLL